MTDEIVDEAFMQIYSLRRSWMIYCELFGSSEDRVKVLHAASGDVAQYLENNGLENIILRISRLTDPPNGRRKSRMNNVSLHAVVNKADEMGAMDSSAWTRWEEIKKLAEPIRDHRDKFIAHSDYEYVRNITEIRGASRSEIDRLVLLISSLFGELGEKIKNTTYASRPRIHKAKLDKFFVSLHLGNEEWNRRWAKEQERILALKPSELRKISSPAEEFPSLLTRVPRESDDLI